MTEEMWKEMLVKEGLYDQLRDPHNLWICLCARAQRNLREEKGCVGFHVIHDSKGRYRIVDGTTQIPMTEWHPNYGDALDQLNGCKVAKVK